LGQSDNQLTLVSTKINGGNMIDVTKATRALPCFVLALAACFATTFAQASTVEVGTCIPTLPHFGTIQAAVNASPVGGTVDVCPGIYAEQVMITNKLTLVGVLSGTSDAAVIVPPAGGLGQNGTDIFGNPVAAQIFVASTTGAVTIEKLTVDATGNNLAGCGAPTLEGIYYQNTSGTITENAVRNQYQTDYADYGGCQNGLAINVESTTSSNTVVVSNNSVRAYQKNGITATGAATGAGAPGPAVTISGNYIVGVAATALNWGPTNAAENGVQIGFGATGSVSTNMVLDNIWGPDTNTDTGDAASGILIYSSDGITVTGNEVGSAQFGIVAVTDSAGFCTNNSQTISCGPADNTTITSNKVVGTQIFDAIDLCSNGNTVESNIIFGSTESGVHSDDTCSSGTYSTTSGNNNYMTKNSIVEACAGILLGTGSGNTFSPNTFLDVTNTLVAGDVCSSGPAAKVKKQHPSPYKANRR
jgi:hypothetical protein